MPNVLRPTFFFIFLIFPLHSYAKELKFVERTEIVNDHDVSGFLGPSYLNIARTKDADIADVNNDSYPDILDANADNVANGSSIVLRLNNGGSGFNAIPLLPSDEAVSYDADLVDLNGDNLPDLIRTQSFGPNNSQTAVYLNQGSQAGWFIMDQPDFVAPMIYCPDDIATGDINNDGLIDFAVSQRLRGRCSVQGTSITSVYLNNGNGQDFRLLENISAPQGISTHDVFFIDIENDEDLDIITVNEDGINSTRLHVKVPSPLHYVLSSETFITAYAGSAEDFNNDGYTDFVLGGEDLAVVYINNPDQPGTFTRLPDLPNANLGKFYDLELGDYDNDGDIDIVGAGLNGSGSYGDVRLWLNDGRQTPAFTAVLELAGDTTFPNHGDYQRLSADMIDFDLDGDLDLYFTGADSQSVGCLGDRPELNFFGIGCVPNQFYENLLDPDPFNYAWITPIINLNLY